MDHVGSKTRSLGQILEKPCVCSRYQIFMKFGQSFCLNEILYMFENQGLKLALANSQNASESKELRVQSASLSHFFASSKKSS